MMYRYTVIRSSGCYIQNNANGGHLKDILEKNEEKVSGSARDWG